MHGFAHHVRANNFVIFIQFCITFQKNIILVFCDYILAWSLDVWDLCNTQKFSPLGWANSPITILSNQIEVAKLLQFGLLKNLTCFLSDYLGKLQFSRSPASSVSNLEPGSACLYSTRYSINRCLSRPTRRPICENLSWIL